MLYDGDMTDPDPEADDAAPKPDESAGPPSTGRRGMCGTFLIRQALSQMPEAERLHYVELFGEVEELCRPIS